MNLRTLAAATILAIGLGACSTNELALTLGDPKQPPELQTLMRMAKQAEAAGRDENAVALYRQAHELHPFDSAPLTAWGFLANRVGALVQAVDIFETALSIDEFDGDARRGLANAYVNLDQPEDALVLYDALIDWDPYDHRAWNGKGVALDMLARHSEAQVAYREGLAAAPGNPNLSNNLGLSLALTGQLDEAIEVLSAVAEGRADIVTARQNLALAHGLNGDRETARRLATQDLPADLVSGNLMYYDTAREALVRTERIRH